MVCENCEQEHDGKYGSGRFCDNKCARGFSTKAKRKEISEKVSKSLKGKSVGAAKNGYDKKKWYASCLITWQKNKELRKENTPFHEWPLATIREHIFEEQKGCCNKCGLDKWLDELITLELEHKDGDNKNNTQENLEFLCPNCHSMTVTWRGRNKNGQNKRVSDAELIEVMKHSPNIRQALIKVGMTPKGNNYLRVKKLMGL